MASDLKYQFLFLSLASPSPVPAPGVLNEVPKGRIWANLISLGSAISANSLAHWLTG